MQDAARRLREKVATQQPDDMVDGVASGAVTVEGTWQKRGHSSKIGVISVILLYCYFVILVKFWIM